jgi:hypothetical protein
VYHVKDPKDRAMEDEADLPGLEEEGIPLIEGWMLGALMFPAAMAEIIRVPPANDLGKPSAR